MDHVIVSRHQAAIEFIRLAAPEFAGAPVLAQAGPDDVKGKVVAGNLPLHLAALAAEMVAVEFAGAPPRGQEYGLAEMQAAGARLTRYTVQRGGEAALLTALQDGGYAIGSSASFAAVVAGTVVRADQRERS